MNEVRGVGSAQDNKMELRDRIKELRRVQTKDLVPNPRNWRMHPETQRSALQAILGEVGIADALLAREMPDGKLELLDGHLRKDVAPDTEWPVLIVDLNDEEAGLLLATLDPLAAMAEADEQALGELLAGLKADDEALQEMLAGLAAEHGIDVFEEAVPEDPGPQIDKAAELQEKWGTRLGQLWLIDGKAGTHRVLCGDSTKAENWEAVAMVVSSPPYPGADMWNERDEQGKADNAERLLALGFDVLALACDHAAVIAWNVGDCPTGKAEMLPTGANVIQWARDRGHLVRWAIWDKGIINPLPPQSFMRRPVVQHITHEWIVTIYPNGWHPREKQCGLANGTHEWQMRSVWTIAPEHASKIGHKAPFPVRLAERCISLWSIEGDTVFDPFLGSGTTLIACEQLGRIGVGIEIEPKYVAVTLERLAGMGLSPRLAEG